jgi:hypothetical protein
MDILADSSMTLWEYAVDPGRDRIKNISGTYVAIKSGGIFLSPGVFLKAIVFR